MTDQKRDVTLFGLPRLIEPQPFRNEDRELPFLLYPYPACGDMHTPSHEVSKDPDAVTRPSPYLPSQRPLTPEERIVVRAAILRARAQPKPGMGPSTLAKVGAAVIVCWLIYLGLGAMLLVH